mmetsp:Transcript_39486/g.90701  ORF Transcript_39486/g.90701 Transcript_39486/m.90701 type:complete len:100 (+) Transcript_39486:1-300(+)
MTIFIMAPVTHWSVKLALTALSKPFVEPNLLDYRPIDWVAHAMVAFLHFLDGQAFSLGIDRNAERNREPNDNKADDEVEGEADRLPRSQGCGECGKSNA